MLAVAKHAHAVWPRTTATAVCASVIICAGLRFMTLNKGAGVHRDDDWEVEAILNNHVQHGRTGLDDVASSDVVLLDEVAQVFLWSWCLCMGLAHAFLSATLRHCLDTA